MPLDKVGQSAMQQNDSSMDDAGIMENEKFLNLSAKEYPELQGMKEGQPISGHFSGSVARQGSDSVQVKIEDMQLETENSADKAYKDMQGPKESPMGKDHPGSEEDMY